MTKKRLRAHAESGPGAGATTELGRFKMRRVGEVEQEDVITDYAMLHLGIGPLFDLAVGSVIDFLDGARVLDKVRALAFKDAEFFVSVDGVVYDTTYDTTCDMEGT